MPLLKAYWSKRLGRLLFSTLPLCFYFCDHFYVQHFFSNKQPWFALCGGIPLFFHILPGYDKTFEPGIVPCFHYCDPAVLSWKLSIYSGLSAHLPVVAHCSIDSMLTALESNGSGKRTYTYLLFWWPLIGYLECWWNPSPDFTFSSPFVIDFFLHFWVLPVVGYPHMFVETFTQ